MHAEIPRLISRWKVASGAKQFAEQAAIVFFNKRQAAYDACGQFLCCQSGQLCDEKDGTMRSHERGRNWGIKGEATSKRSLTISFTLTVFFINSTLYSLIPKQLDRLSWENFRVQCVSFAIFPRRCHGLISWPITLHRFRSCAHAWWGRQRTLITRVQTRREMQN